MHVFRLEDTRTYSDVSTGRDTSYSAEIDYVVSEIDYVVSAIDYVVSANKKVVFLLTKNAIVTAGGSYR